MSEFMENFSWLDLRHAVEHEPTPLDFVLPGFKSGTVGALVSPGATGKTMLALQAAITVSGALTYSISLAWTQHGSEPLAELYSSQVKILAMCLMGVFTQSVNILKK